MNQSDSEHSVVPLFQLGVNVLPGELLPLHIFEPRYRNLLRHCLEREAPFAVALYLNGKAFDQGCLVKVVSVIKEYDDGRSDIVVAATRVIELVQVLPEEEFGFPRAHVKVLSDHLEVEQPSDREKIPELLKQWYTLVDQSLEELPSLEGLGAYTAASLVPLDVQERQELLTKRSEKERRDLVIQLLEFRCETVRSGGLSAFESMHAV